MDMFGVTVPTFPVTDPFDNIVAFLAMLKDVTPGRRLRVAFHELAFVLDLLLLFLTLGGHILSGLGLSHGTAGIAGGIILFVIVMRLISPSSQGLLGEVPDGESSLISPVTPAVAGPSVPAMLIVLRTTFGSPLWELYLAMALVWVTTALILLQTTFLQRFFGPRGLTAIERLAGMLLIMLNVDMLPGNLRNMLHATT